MKRHRERRHIAAFVTFLCNLAGDIEAAAERWSSWCDHHLPHGTVLSNWLLDPLATVVLLAIYLATAPFVLLAGLLANLLRFL